MNWVLILALVLASVFPYVGLNLDSSHAYAASDRVTLSRVGNIDYKGGRWNTHIFRANDESGDTFAYCVQPEKNSPPDGSYAKSKIRCSSDDRNFELRADLWFAYGGPGFDKSMWPSTNWDGNPMSNNDYYLASHILLADTYSSNLYTATYGASKAFRDWLAWNIIGYGTGEGMSPNANAVGRQALARAKEVPNNFEAFQIDGGASQNIVACSVYHPYGNMRIEKHSSAPEITEGNANYSLRGIAYGIFTQADCSESSNTGRKLVLDASGCAEAEELLEGTYYVRELEDSLQGTGYAYDATIYSCDVIGGETSMVQTRLDTSLSAEVLDEPITEPPSIIVQKYDVLTKSTIPSGDANMADAQFEVRFYANDKGSTAGDPTRRWVFKTNDEGRIDLHADGSNAFVSGDALFRDPKNGAIVFPLGTYAVTELCAPASYEPVTNAQSHVFTIRATGTGNHDTNWSASQETVRFDERPLRHDLAFTKKDADTQRPMAGIPFLLSRVSPDNSIIEEHVIVTDANGAFSSSVAHANHSTRTNANDGAISRSADGTIRVDEDMLDSDAGVWFGIAHDGNWIAPDDSYGAFPDSTACKYVFKELPVQANKGKALVRFEAYAHGARCSTIDLGTVNNSTPTLATVALDGLDGDKIVSRSKEGHVHDSVAYGGLVAGQTYALEGKLVDARTGETVLDQNNAPVQAIRTFTAAATSGTVEQDFAFDATVMSDGTRLVVCETLLEGDRLLAAHDDLADSSQTVTVVQPALSTQASDALDGDSIIMGDIDASIVDTVRYTGLVPGNEYTLTALLMDKTSEQPFNTSAGPVTASVTFVASTSTGSQDVSLAFDASELAPGTKLVVFERLSQDGTDIASHEDIEDANQTVTVQPPSLKTQARDAEDDDSIVSADTCTTIIDTVSYSGLAPGHEYNLSAALVDKETGEPILDTAGNEVSSQHAFTPIETSGETDVRIDFDATSLACSKGAVVLERLYREGHLISSHIDLNSASQTIVIELPDMLSFASSDGTSKEIMRDTEVPVIDSVSFRNLKAGSSYRLIGTIMNKQSGEPLRNQDGTIASSSCEFVAEASTGIVSVSFTIDSLSLEEGDQLVVFERLFKDEIELVSHEDMDDPRQTLTVKQPILSTEAASNDRSKNVIRDVDSTIIDTVSYAGLTPGHEYRLEGTLIDKTTGSLLLDSEGNALSFSELFTPERATGSTALSLTFDASDLADGTELVVFERLFMGETQVASHEDVEDASQTVRIVPCTIMTFANDPDDGDKIVSAYEKSRIVDSVTFDGLQAGFEYEFVGTLIDKETQEPLRSADGKPIQATKSFTPRIANGTVDVRFDFDASNIEGAREAVIFQELYRDNSLIATHAEMQNASQTIMLEAPRLETEARDGEDGDKELPADGLATIVDTVSYSGLVAGEEYELDGTLMVDDGAMRGAPLTDALGRQVTAHATFTPDAAHGSIELSFELDTSLLDKKAHVVVFERLFHERTLVAEHCDIADEDQTVYMPEGRPRVLSELLPDDETPLAAFGSVAKMGDTAIRTLIACFAIGMCAFGLLAILRRKAFGSHHLRE